jgi:D-glycero-D-manno-heptose 1,7-bisphosphate phosphatase
MKNKAVFLDRDGVVNRELGRYVYTLDEFVINPGLIQAIKKLKDAGYLVIIITNQGGIARGIYKKEKVQCLHNILSERLMKLGVAIDEIYICPHHDDYEKCLCRKPGSLLIEKAIARFNIDPKKSLMIGDSDRDVKAANNAGVRGVKIVPNTNILSVIEDLL